MNDLKVYSAGVGGLVATSFGWENLDAVLDVFVRLGQIGVAVVTILYIYSKWKASRKVKRRAKRASKNDDHEL